MIRVFVDTSIARYADQERTVFGSQKKSLQWGALKIDVDVPTATIENPLTKLSGAEHRHTVSEANLIPKIDKLAKDELIELLWDFETNFEYLRNRPANQFVPEFVDRIKQAHSAIFYGRVAFSAIGNEDEQFAFLARLSHPEYDKWKKLVGVVAGSKNERNQLMDAWHLWSAAHNHCEYFLTMDRKVIASVRSRKHSNTLRLVTPSQFLAEFKHLNIAARLERRAWMKIRAKQS